MKEEEIALKMKQFETMINTADKSLADELIASDASFYTPASPEPVFGGDGYFIGSVFYAQRFFRRTVEIGRNDSRRR